MKNNPQAFPKEIIKIIDEHIEGWERFPDKNTKCRVEALNILKNKFKQIVMESNL